MSGHADANEDVTSLPAAAKENDIFRITKNADRPYSTMSEAKEILLPAGDFPGSFVAGAGSNKFPRENNPGSWVSISIKTTNPSRTAVDLLMSWKEAEVELSGLNAEFKIISFKESDHVQGLLEIEKPLYSAHAETLLDTASHAMLAMTGYLRKKGYQV